MLRWVCSLHLGLCMGQECNMPWLSQCIMGELALLWSCWPREDAAWLFGFHPQRHQACWLVFSLGPLNGGGSEASWEAMERVETIDTRMMRWMVVVWVTGGRGHAHEALQIAMGVRVWTHAG